MTSASDPISDPRRRSSGTPGGAPVEATGSAWGPVASALFGLLFVGAGLAIVGVGEGWIPVDDKGMHAPRIVIVAAGAVFAIAGVAVAGGGRWPAWLNGLFGALICTALFGVGAWVAFGEGPRRFGGSGVGVAAWFGWDSESVGRWAFGLGAAVTGLVCLVAWTAWLRALGPAGRLAAIGCACLGGYLVVEVMPREPHLDGTTDDHARIAHYLAMEPAGIRGSSRNPRSWNMLPWRDTEAWLKAARTRVAAARAAPPGAEVLTVPTTAVAPRIDGVEAPGEWDAALWIPLRGAAEGTAVGLLVHGGRLYVTARAPADTTETGYDQFRFWFHLDLSPRLANERVFVRGSGRSSSLRSVRDEAGAAPARRPRSRKATAGGQRTQWQIYERVESASRVDGHRRYELSLDMVEAGIVPGAGLPAYFVIEGDPVLDESGKFRARRILGRAGHRSRPLWLRVGT